MAKLLDLLVAEESFVPVAGRVYAQDGDWWVNPYCGGPKYHNGDWKGDALRSDFDCGYFTLADDYQTAIITAEAILKARACL